jgi:DNA-binding winged helix-turn-helix (wHTH) protein
MPGVIWAARRGRVLKKLKEIDQKSIISVSLGGRTVRFRFDPFTVDEETRQLLRSEREVHLSHKAFDLLTALLRARPRALSKAELHAHLWPDTFVSDANLAMLVAEIRDAIDDDARAPRFVRTVQRHGYAFHGTATELAKPDAPAARSKFKYWMLASLRQIPLVAGENLVGRDPSVQVWLDSRGVSRLHARISVDRDRVTLEDLKSKNGTRVRGQLVTAAVPLVDGDEIRFGSVVVTFKVWDGGEMTRTEFDQ